MFFQYLYLIYSIFYSQMQSLHPNFMVLSNKYHSIKVSLDYDNPGFGVSDYGNYDVVDIPKAYAMVLSAELMRYKINKNYDLTLAKNAGYWLLTNADLNKDNIIGWGVPVAWDAYGDGSINEENTEYTISTAIVINALLDWIEMDDNAPRHKIVQLIEMALQPYISEDIFTSEGLLNYSLKEVDRKYNTFNPAVYMAGQIQRFSYFTENETFKESLRFTADKVIASILKFKKEDPQGGWYWTYSIEENIPNDLTHAGYIIDGIINYINYNGKLSYLINKEAVLNHLNLFSDKNGREWYFYPKTSDSIKLVAPRLYGVGFTLYLLSKYKNDKIKIKNLIEFSDKYRLKNDLYSRWQNEEIVIVEYLAYFLYGLSSVEYYTHPIYSKHYLN